MSQIKSFCREQELLICLTGRHSPCCGVNQQQIILVSKVPLLVPLKLLSRDMGRTDLARFRKTAPSITPAVLLPQRFRTLLQSLSAHPLHHAVHAIQTLHDASSQRAQVAAVKLLGTILYDAHQVSSPLSCPCVTQMDSAASTSLYPTGDAIDNPESLTPCQLIVPILAAFLFEIPNAIPALISASLRSFLRVHHLNLPLVQHAHRVFFKSISHAPLLLKPSDSRHPSPYHDNALISSLACYINTAAVMLAEPESKLWIFSDIHLIRAILSISYFLTDLFILMARASTATAGENPSSSSSQQSPPEFSNTIDTNLVEAACDSSMKAIQDIVNAFYTKNICFDLNDSETRKLVTRSVDSCHSLLLLPSTPRSCSLACAITFVTGHILLRYEYSKIETLINALKHDVLAKVLTYPPFSQLSILRAVLEAPISKPALSQILFPSLYADCTEIEKSTDTVFSVLISLTTKSSDVHFRYLAMEAVISCVRRVSSDASLSDGCRDAVLSLVYKRWDEPFAGVTTQMRDTLEALVAVCPDKDFWREMARTLVIRGDWHCKGMYSPLGVLIVHVGASVILDSEPRAPVLAMCAMAEDSRLTKAVSDWLESLWSTLLIQECLSDVTEFVKRTAPHVVDALLDPSNRTLRERVAEHVLPVYMQCSRDKRNVLDIGRALLDWLSSLSLPTHEAHAARVRGSVMVLAVARRNGVSSLADFGDLNTRKLLRDALRSEEEDLRAAAFDVVVSSGVPTQPILQHELDLVLAFIPVALTPGASPADRSRFRHAMRRMLERVGTCIHAAREGTGGWWSRQRKARATRKLPLSENSDLEEERVALLKRLEQFEKRCVSTLVSAAFPGSSFARRTSAMEVLRLVVENLGPNALLRYGTRDDGNGYQTSAVATLVAGLLDEWERPRRASMEVVQAIPAPLPGLATTSEARVLLKTVFPMLNSPRLKDVDAAASVYRVIFQKVVLQTGSNNSVAGDVLYEGANSITYLTPGMKQNGDLLPFDESKQGIKECTTSRALVYAMYVLDSVECIIKDAETNLMSACAKGLFHGHFLQLRYIVQDFPWKAHMVDKLKLPLAKFVQRFVTLADKCVRVALEGVSFQKFNQGTVGYDSTDTQDPLQNRITTDENDGESARDAIFLQHGRQLESTSCFLSAKEICVALGVLSHQAPLLESTSIKDIKNAPKLLDQESIELIGELFTFVFTSTRHWGVIDGASEGFQLLCERLLSNSSLRLRALPQQWVMAILARALGGELYVLRRSAGIPWLICAIVNAEASINRRSHESPILNSIVALLIDHMHCANTEEKNQASLNSEEKSALKGEESVSHALNLLRALFLNSNIGSNMLKHLESATICCIDAFCSSSWLVRNSSLMLYSALIRRGVGVCRERKDEDVSFSLLTASPSPSPVSSFKAAGGTSATLEGARRLTGTTAFQFFSRHPKLHPFLLEHLERAVRSSGEEGDHPVLFPTLYLLSCLSPNTNEDPSTQISMAKFVHVVESCARWKSDYVRRAAAAARVALIDDCTQAPSIVRKILLSLPKGPKKPSGRQLNSSVIGEAEEQRQHRSSFEQNWLHGELLTVVAILQNTVGVMSRPDKQRLLEALCDTLPEVLWIATNGRENACSITRGCMIDVANIAYRLAVVEECETLRSMIENVAQEVISDDFLRYGSLSKIGFSTFRIKAIQFYGQFITRKVELGQWQLNEAVESLCRRIESRDEDEKGLVGCLEICCSLLSNSSKDKMNTLAPNVLERLWIIIDKTLREKRRLEVLVACLGLWVSLLNVLGKSDATVRRCSQRSKEVFALAENDGCVDVQERALVVIGQLVGAGYCDDKSIIRWMDLLLASLQSQASSLRIAVCTSIEKSNSYNGAIMKEVKARSYLILARLLEDDSTEVRRYALTVSRNCMSVTIVGNQLVGHFLPTMISIYRLLSDSYGSSVALFREFEVLFRTDSHQDSLMNVMSDLVDSKLKNEIKSRRTHDFSNMADASKTNNENEKEEKEDESLFQLENACGDGESVLQMQLMAWSYACTLQHRGESTVKGSLLNGSKGLRLSDVKEMALQTVKELQQEAEVLIQETEVNTDGDATSMTICGGMFGNDGFKQIVKHILRVFLGLCCLYNVGFTSGADEFIELKNCLQKILSVRSSTFHPVIRESVHGLLDKLSGRLRTRNADAIDDGRVLFLLSTDDLNNVTKT